MKKWIAGLLCVCMLLTMCPMVMAEEIEAAEEPAAEDFLTEEIVAEADDEQLPEAPVETEPEEEEELPEEETEPVPAEEEIPEETIPEALPEETIPEEVPDETVPEEAIPEETEAGEEEQQEVITEWYTFETDGPRDDGTTTESRMMRYLRMPFTGPVDKKRSSSMFQDILNSMEQAIYNASKAMAAEVAAGKRSSTEVSVTLDLSGTKYTAAELGVSTLVENGKLNKAAMDAVTARVDIDFDKIYWAVLGDCPYEMYWEGHYGTSNSFGFSSDGNKIWMTDTVKMSWSVADVYSATGATSFQADTAKTGRTAGALETVHRIVEGNASLGNKEKLNAYQNAICELADYNTPAANGQYPYYYGDPWQLIYVFDGDPTTKVVCEGYAKAFQYLCEQSSFRGSVYAVCVSGNATFSDGTGGAHMWNIVHMEDGKNYHVDVTNSDGGSRSNNRYFMTVPSGGSVAEGYRVSGSLFQYDKQTKTLFTEEQLTLSMTGYGAGTVITSHPSSQTVLENSKVQFSVSASGTRLSYQWQYLAPNGFWQNCGTAYPGYNTNTLTVTGTAERNGNQFRCVVTDSSGKQLTSDSAVLTVIFPVRITAQPENRSVAENETAVFRVAATGTGLSYQWQFRGSAADAQWTNCTAATEGYRSDTLKPVANLSRNGYQYRCVVTDSYGQKVTSDAATLTIQLIFQITSQPADQTVMEDTDAVFRVTASGYGLSYLWQYQAPNGVWRNCNNTYSGYNTDTLTVHADAANNGYRFRCVVTNSNSKQIASESAALTVNLYVRITSQPEDQSVQENGSVEFRVSAAGTGLSYQWQYLGSGSGAEWTNCTSATEGYRSDTLRPAASLSRDGYQYRCVITDTYGKKVTSEAAALTVLANVKIIGQPANQTVAAGDTASFTVKASGSNLSYRWQMQTPGSSAWVDCPVFYVGSRTDTLSISAGASFDGDQFRCIVNDSFGNSVTSSPAVLTVGKALQILHHPISVTVQPNTAGTLLVEAVGTDLVYQWQYKNNLGGIWANCTAATEGYNTSCLKPVGTISRNGYQYRCVVKDAFGTVRVSNSAVLAVSSGLKITRHPADSSAQLNTAAVFTVAASGTGLTYQWQYRNAAGGGWVNCTASTKGYNTPVLRPVSSEMRNGYQYRCRVTDAYGMYVISNPAVLHAFSTLKITRQPVGGTFNAGAAAAFRVEATGTNVTYQWQYRNATGGGWVNCTTVTAGYNTATLKPVASMLRSGYQYRCIVTDAYGVSLISTPATLTVITTLRILSQPVSQTVPAGTPASFTVMASGLGLTYRWEYRTSSKSAWAPCTSAFSGNNTPTLRPAGITANDGFQFRCAITDQYGNTIRTNPVLLTVQ